MTCLPAVLVFVIGLAPIVCAQSLTSCIEVGDLDGDGALDLVFGNRRGSDQVFRNTGKGRFVEVELPEFAKHASDSSCVALGDVDGDGDLDIVFGASASVSVFENKGKMAFVKSKGLSIETPKECRAIALLDVDADKDLDLVVATFGTKDDLFINDGKGGFTRADDARWPVRVAYSTCLVAVDFDSDGDVDILFGAVRGPDGKVSGQNQLLRNDGKGAFSDATAALPKDASNTSFLLVTPRGSSGGVAVIQGTVGGRPGSPARMRLLHSVGPLLKRASSNSMTSALMRWAHGELLDFDGDGDDDLVLTDGGTLVRCANVAGSFRKTTKIRVTGLVVPEGISAIHGGDVDGDGEADLIVAHANSKMVLRGNGVGGFVFVAGDDLLVNRGDSVMGMIVRHRLAGVELAPDLGPSTDRYRLRFAGREGVRAVRRGSARAIRLGLEWLAQHQDKDGRWDSDGFMKHDKRGRACDGPGHPGMDVGVTGLALLAFLGDGHTTKVGQHRENVVRGLKWLRTQQSKKGMFGVRGLDSAIYAHSIATQVFCEAYCMTGDAALLAAATKAIGYLEMHRNPYACWRYEPRDNRNDLSVTGWAVQAMVAGRDCKIKAARKGPGLKIAANFLDELTDLATGRCGYMRKGEYSSRLPGDHEQRFPLDKTETLTAIGLHIRFTLGQDPARTPVMKLAAEMLRAKPPVWDRTGSIDHYYWYYATNAMYRMGGRSWKEWSRHLTAAVVRPQRSDGAFEGSWDPNGVWGGLGGRVYSTAILALTLEAPYRFAHD